MFSLTPCRIWILHVVRDMWKKGIQQICSAAKSRVVNIIRVNYEGAAPVMRSQLHIASPIPNDISSSGLTDWRNGKVAGFVRLVKGTGSCDMHNQGLVICSLFAYSSVLTKDTYGKKHILKQ